MKNFVLFMLFLVTIFFIFVLILLSLSFIFFYSSDSNENGSISVLPSYQYQEYDPNSKSTSFGFVTINKRLSDNEFISYQNDETGSTTIISNFADSQYECNGHCTCSSDRRSTTTFLTRSLYILFSALSSSVAFKIAEQSFRDQCVLQFSSTCDEENISSEVQSCTEKEESSNNDDEDEYAEYSCEGHCVPKKIRFGSPSTLRAQRDFINDEGKCEDLKTSGIVKIKRTTVFGKLKYFHKGTQEVKIYDRKYHQMYRDAQGKFSHSFLIGYCREMSTIRYLWESPNKPKSSKYLTTPMCVGRGKSHSRINIKCQLISGRLKAGPRSTR